VPFTIPVPDHSPFNVLYDQTLPGFTLGVRTELTVSSGSAKGDFDPVRIQASPVQQSIMDALGAIGAKFAGNAVRPGSVVGLPAPGAQAITFYAPVPEGQQLGPHIPQVTFVVAGTPTGVTVIAELAARPGTGKRHELTQADIDRLSAGEDAWVSEVDSWLLDALQDVGKQAPGSFLQQPAAPMAAGAGRPGQQGYAYGGRGGPGYQYGGYQRRGPSMGGAMMAGVAGGALGFLGTMMIADMLTPDMPVDAGMEDMGAADAGGDYGADAGGDYGGDFGGDFGGGDWGGGFGEF
jgi:sporulation-control protein